MQKVPPPTAWRKLVQRRNSGSVAAGMGCRSSTAADEVNELAVQVADSGGVMLVPAFTGWGTPHWDPQARGND